MSRVREKEEIKTKQLPLAVQNEPPAEATDDYLRPARSLSYGVLPSRQRIPKEFQAEGAAPGYSE